MRSQVGYECDACILCLDSVYSLFVLCHKADMTFTLV